MIRARYIKQNAKEIGGTSNWLALKWSDGLTPNITESMKVLAQTIKLLRQNGVKVCVSCMPHYYQYRGLQSSLPHQLIQAFCEKTKTPYLNSYQGLMPLIYPSPMEKYYSKGDPTHFNPDGHEIWGALQLEFLSNKDNDLIPAILDNL
jgi:hypothetical protein